MRADMAKVIVERPRRGGQGSRKGRIRNFDLLPTNEESEYPVCSAGKCLRCPPAHDGDQRESLRCQETATHQTRAAPVRRVQYPR